MKEEKKKKQTAAKTSPETQGGKAEAQKPPREIPSTEFEAPQNDAKADAPKEDAQKAQDIPADAVIFTREDADRIEAKMKEAQELNDKYLRMLAEYDNYRKRTAAEREGIYADAYGDALGELLPVFDNLERASATGDEKGIADGVRITLKQFEAALGKLGVEAYGAAGDAFDPTIHNAVMHVEDEAVTEATVIEVFQRGYRRGDRILRFAMVKVAN